MDRLSSGERDRVVAVLDDALERLMLLSYVPLESNASVLSELNAEGYALLEAHWALEASAPLQPVKPPPRRPEGFDFRRSDDNGLKARSDDNGLKARSDDDPETDAAFYLQRSCLSLCRGLRESPKTFAALQRFQEATLKGPRHGGDFLALVSALNGVRGTYDRSMARTLQDQASLDRTLKTTVQRTAVSQHNAGALSQCLDQARATKEAEAAECDVAAGAYNDEIATFETLHQKTKFEIDTATATSLAAMQLDNAAALEALRAAGAKVQLEVEQTRANAVDEEERLRKKGHKLEMELRAAVDHYDTTMFAKEAEVAQLQATYEAEIRETNDLQAYFDMVDVDTAAEAAEEVVLLAQRRKAAGELRIFVELVVRLQSAWRGKAARSAVAVKRAAAKKPKKPKKKK